MPAILASRAAPSLFPRPSPYSRPAGPRSPSNPNPPPPLVPPPSSRRRPDSPPSVSPAPIPRTGSFSSPSSSDFGPHPALSPFLQGCRRAPRSAAASARRDAPPPPLLASITAGEARRLLLFPVRVSPWPLRPRLAPPPSAAAAASRRARVLRGGRAHAAVKAGLALTRLGGPLARGPRLSAPGLAGWGCT